jgi:hypothetical protein
MVAPSCPAVKGSLTKTAILLPKTRLGFSLVVTAHRHHHYIGIDLQEPPERFLAAHHRHGHVE